MNYNVINSERFRSIVNHCYLIPILKSDLIQLRLASGLVSRQADGSRCVSISGAIGLVFLQ